MPVRVFKLPQIQPGVYIRMKEYNKPGELFLVESTGPHTQIRGWELKKVIRDKELLLKNGRDIKVFTTLHTYDTHHYEILNKQEMLETMKDTNADMRTAIVRKSEELKKAHNNETNMKKK